MKCKNRQQPLVANFTNTPSIPPIVERNTIHLTQREYNQIQAELQWCRENIPYIRTVLNEHEEKLKCIPKTINHTYHIPESQSVHDYEQLQRNPRASPSSKPPQQIYHTNEESPKLSEETRTPTINQSYGAIPKHSFNRTPKTPRKKPRSNNKK